MNEVVTVREYARLTTQPVQSSLDCAQITESAFAYLCKISEGFSKSGAHLLQIDGRQWLRLDNYVGVLSTPCGTTLEVLPKHQEEGDSVTSCRALLRKMILATLGLRGREAGPALLQRFDVPLTEWIIRRFLEELDLLVRRGVRFDYERIEERQPFLRGQLDVMAQIRQPPGRDHHFNVRHDIFTPDRPENRLLSLALDHARKATKEPDNWRLAQELSIRLAEVVPSSRVSDDFRAWSADRLMVRYRAIKPWCELILLREIPLALAGNRLGLSMMFPMEKLFERYVAGWFQQSLAHGVRLRFQASTESLCVHLDRQIFQLEPDLLLSKGPTRWVFDTKWKRLDGNDRDNKYKLSQADIYQMFAYGHKYMGGTGTMALVYPMTERFKHVLPPFEMGRGFNLFVLPFDIERDELMCVEELGAAIFDSSSLSRLRSTLSVPA